MRWGWLSNHGCLVTVVLRQSMRRKCGVLVVVDGGG